MPLFVYNLLFSLAAVAVGFYYARLWYLRGLHARSLLTVYLAVSAVAVNLLVSVGLSRGIDGLKLVINTGPVESPAIVGFYVAIAWLLLGSIMLLLDRRVITRQNCLPYVGFYLVAFLYLTILRERLLLGDIADYAQAASNLYYGEPLHSRYLYPPFWAWCLKPLVPFGPSAILVVCVALNYMSLLLFYVLLYQVLRRYSFPRNTAALCVAAILCLNVPVLRTMAYVQVNIHVANLILLSLLLWRQNVFVSALALALAVHMKASPIILILPFILARQSKWVAYFVVITAAIAGLTMLSHGTQCYQDYFTNVAHVYEANEISFRENSIDSFVRATYMMMGISVDKASFVIWPLKLLLVIASLWVMVLSVRRKVHYGGDESEAAVYNGYVVLVFLMMMLSPLVWEHHPVFIIFAFLLMLRRVDGVLEWMLYVAAYVLIFLMPTFDFYPLSYNRLAGVALCYILFFTFLRGGERKGEWIENTDHGLDRLLASGRLEL